MVPSSLLGLVLFVTLLAPGLAYVLRHERVVPAAQQSAFREALRVISISVTCLVLAGLVLAGIRWLWPEGTVDVRGLVQDPAGYARANHERIAWWGLGALAFATVVAWLWADPRRVERSRRRRTKGLRRWFVGPAPLSKESAWRTAIVLLADPPATDTVKPKRETFVGAQMADGTYVSGYVVTSSPDTTENDERDMILTRAKLRTLDGKQRDLGSMFTVISARHITRLDVTHIEPVADQPSSGGEEEADEPSGRHAAE